MTIDHEQPNHQTSEQLRLQPKMTAFTNSLNAPLADIAASLKGLTVKDRTVRLRDAIKQGRNYQLNLDLKRANIEQVIHEWALFIDHIMMAAWESMDWPPEAASKICLVAVGGYGRGELHPYSDIDILILLTDTPSQTINHSIETFLTLSWDIKLDIGHSVRTIAECVEAATNDITVATTLLESRLITGPNKPYDELMVLTGPNYIWNTKAFFKAKRKEQKQRHKKHGDTVYNLEPDIKNAPGGLRDLQTINWITNRYFQGQENNSIVTQWFLTDDELNLLQKSKLFLWKVRFALHILTERNENRLLFNYQKELALLLGYEKSNANLAVEIFMKQYYRCVMELSELNALIFQHFYESILQDSEKSTITPINSRFQIRNGYIEVTAPDIFNVHPSALLEIFVILAQNDNIAGIRASTTRLIRNNCHLIDDAFRSNPLNNSLFIELLRSPFRLSTQLRRMKRSGILGRYIPAFGDIMGQMQYDLFHIYTVDAHTLLVIKNMRRFRYTELRTEFPLAYEICHRLPKIELLYLAGLYHDLGKGRGGDHSTIGAQEAEQFCLNHKLTRWDARLVSWLVQHHLLMSLTAQKKDVTDPEVINEFARTVGDQISLDYLYALTVADICATNPKLWNNWKATLVRQLYKETRRALRRGLENPINKDEWISETKERSLILLRINNIFKEDVDPIWNQIPDDYFMRENAEDIAWHTQAILTHANLSGASEKGAITHFPPLILIKKSGLRGQEGATQIFVYTEDKPNLFAKSVIALDALGLSIQDARIMTSKCNFSLDTYIVLNQGNRPIDLNNQQIEHIQSKLASAIKEEQLTKTNHRRLMPRQLKNFSIRTEIMISNQPDRSNTIIELRALDRPGLLATVGRVFHEFNLLVNNARIATLGECAEDVFFVTDNTLNGITDPDVCKAVQEALYNALEKNLNNATL